MNYFLINLLWCKQNFSSKFLPLLFYLVFFRSFLQLMEHFRNLQRLLNRSLISSSEFIPRGQHCDLASEIYQGNLSVLWLILLNHISKDTCNLMGGKSSNNNLWSARGKNIWTVSLLVVRSLYETPGLAFECIWTLLTKSKMWNPLPPKLVLCNTMKAIVNGLFQKENSK